MQFRLSTVLLLFVVLWSSLAVFGPAGVVVFALVVWLAIGIARSWHVFLWLLAMLVLLALMLPAGSSARGLARRCTCMNNMKQIALALHNYHSANGCFPPAYIADKNGQPMHSWRVLILPYLDRDLLYKQYNFSEPWNGPNNKKLLASCPREYACPSDENANAQDAAQTNYVAVVGPNAAWSGEKPRKAMDIASLSQTIMVVEVVDSGINWTEPRDLSLGALEAAGTKSSAVTVSSRHGDRNDFFFTYRFPYGANVAMADGSVQYLPPEALTPEALLKYLKMGGCKNSECDNERYTPPAWSGERRLNWGNCLALAVWLVSVGLLLYRAVRSRKMLAAKAAADRAGQGTAKDSGQTPMTQEQ
jgi:prepilin-type processing-associated H-X9-DG protein